MAVVCAIARVPTDEAALDTLQNSGRHGRHHGEANMNDDSATRVRRPWGWYDSLDRGECFRIRRIMINPGELISPKIDDHRTGRWIVVQGTARVTVGERTVTLKDDESVLIPHGERYGLENVGPNPLDIIEVQVGSRLQENDAVWSEDGHDGGSKDSVR